MKKIAIIGGGAAGLTAAVYALRANAEVTMFEQFGLGGLLANIDKIENFPSYKTVEGWQLAAEMASQAKALGLKVIRQKVLSLTKNDGVFTIITDKDAYEFPSVVVSTGTAHNKLGIEGDFVGRGVSYCATCDGNFYKGQTVVVIGQGNQAVREALYLADVCGKTYVIAASDKLTADEKSVGELLAHSNAEVIYNATVSEIYGEEVVSGISVYSDGEVRRLDARGVFIAVGAAPVTDFIKIDGIDKRNGYLAVNSRCETSVQGLFAAGDVTDGALKQIVTACGDGAKAGSFAAAYAKSVK